MTSKATLELWSERVRGWRASGQSAAEFASGKGFMASTLEWRARELRRLERSMPRLRRVVRTPAPAASAVKPAPESSRATVRVHVGGAELLVAADFDPSLVRALVRCLREDAS